MNYLIKKRLALMKNKTFHGYMKTASGYPLTLSNCMENGLINLKISGDSIQDGTPFPESPIDVQSVGDKTNNLFDITKIQHERITVSGNTMYVYQNSAHITKFSPEQFLEMTGLKPGDEILTSLNKSIIKASSSPGVWGRLVFLGKNSNKSFLLCDYRTDMLISTIPENFSSETYGNLTVYGANLDDNGESLIEIKDIVITSNTDNRFYQSEDIENPQSTITIEQENGLYTLNGTNSSDESIVLSQNIDFKIPVRNEYVLIAEVLSGETNALSGTVYIKINNDRSLNFPVNNRLEGFSNILTKTPASVSITFSADANIVFNNVKLKVSVIEYKRLSYEPYGYKIPFTIEGNNLFDVSILSDASDNITIDDSKVIATGGYLLSTTITPEQFLEMTGLKPGDEMIFQAEYEIIKGSGGSVGVFRFGSKNKQEFPDFPMSVTSQLPYYTTIPDNFNSVNYAAMSIYLTASTDENGEREVIFSNIAITKKNAVKDYYTASNIVSLQNGITVSYDKDSKIYTLNGTTSGTDNIVINTGSSTADISTNSFVELNIEKGNIEYSEPIRIRIPGIFTSYGLLPKEKGTAIIRRSIDNQSEYQIYFENIKPGVVFDNYQFKVCIYEKPDYEPYHESYSYNIFLDEPLRKCGEYADYIDYHNKKVIRNVHKYNITGKENFYFPGGTTANGLIRQYFTPQPLMPTGSAQYGYGNFLPNLRQYWNNWTDETLHFGQVNGVLYIITREQFTTGTDVYNYLSNNGKNNIYVIYGLREPIEEDINIEKIQIKKGTNIISAETDLEPSNMEAEYYSDKEG